MKSQASRVILASATSSLALSPPFLVGSLAVQMGADLQLTPSTLGVAVSSFFAATALSSRRLGGWIDRTSTRTGLLVVVGAALFSLLSLSLVTSLAFVVMALMSAGVANGAVQPAANRLLADGDRSALGLALGIKQSALPAASLLGGLAVPTIALTVGWRWVFVVATGLGLLLLIRLLRLASPDEPRQPAAPLDQPAVPPGRSWVKLISVGAGAGAVVGSCLGAFLVDSGVSSAGLSPAGAGLLAAAASAAALTVRVGSGWLADRTAATDPVTIVLRLLCLGSVGFVLMGLGGQVAFAIGAILAFGAGFGWTGLVHFAVIADGSVGPGRATGLLMSGFAFGSASGPLIMGRVAQEWGYANMWWVIAAVALASASLMAVTRRVRSASLA